MVLRCPMFTALPDMPDECDGALPDQPHCAVDAGMGAVDGVDRVYDAYPRTCE